MIASSFDEALEASWLQTHLLNRGHALVLLRQVIPWQRLIEQLSSFYSEQQGRYGRSLRTMIALLILSRLRQLSDEQVVAQVAENRYFQYFCNVPDEALSCMWKGGRPFVHPSTLCRFRQRLGEAGIALIEEGVFERLRAAGVIDAETLLMDSTVLANHLIYPNDVRLLYCAFSKMGSFAQSHELEIWWDAAHLKQRWRAFNLSKVNERSTYLAEFYLLFAAALADFRRYAPTEETSSQPLLSLLELLNTQTQQKLAGERHIENRLVSLDEVDARPIKKGKRFPTCEFGTTLQMSFNRQGFMVTTENFIGQPGDATLYADTLQRFIQRTQQTPDTAVTDLGYRSRDNFTATPEEIEHVFLGRSDDVEQARQNFCHKARAATEGFIAVAKNLRGFGKSLYRRLTGDRIWTLLCQTAYNLKKLLQLYRQHQLSEDSLRGLGIVI